MKDRYRMEYLQSQPHTHGIYLRLMNPQPDLTDLKSMGDPIRFQVRLVELIQVLMELEGRLRFRVRLQLHVTIRMVLEYHLVPNLLFPRNLRLRLRTPILRPIRIVGQLISLCLLNIIPRMTGPCIPLLRHMNAQCRVYHTKEQCRVYPRTSVQCRVHHTNEQCPVCPRTNARYQSHRTRVARPSSASESPRQPMTATPLRYPTSGPPDTSSQRPPFPTRGPSRHLRLLSSARASHHPSRTRRPVPRPHTPARPTTPPSRCRRRPTAGPAGPETT